MANGRIKQLSHDKFDELEAYWKERVAPNSIKFIPASGAATRMFQSLNVVFSAGHEKISDIKGQPDFLAFWKDIRSFPFFGELKVVLHSHGLSIDEELAAGNIRNVLRYLLTDDGMGYATKPKLFLTFHFDDGKPRLAMEEHIKEAIWLTGGKVHFTVSPAFVTQAKQLAEHLISEYARHGINISIDFSIQDPSTDAVAVIPETGELYRTQSGDIFFRQSGHGALSLNLNSMDTPYVLIQNVDNLPGGDLEILKWKRAFLGYFARLEENIFEWVRRLSGEVLAKADIKTAYNFVVDFLKRPIDGTAYERSADKQRILLEAINRPLVLAAMVPNAGEPGGGPFAVIDPKTGLSSNQIVECAQQNWSDPVQSEVVKKATHFNPVFLVVGMQNAFGEKFDLSQYARRDDGYVFYAEKFGPDGKKFASFDTGLWNGEIADAMIVFVEMPIETFGPAKTVLDLSPNIRPFRTNPYPEIINMPFLEVLNAANNPVQETVLAVEVNTATASAAISKTLDVRVRSGIEKLAEINATLEGIIKRAEK